MKTKILFLSIICFIIFLPPCFSQGTDFSAWLEKNIAENIESLLKNADTPVKRIELEYIDVCELNKDTCIIYGQYTVIENDTDPLCFENPHHLFMLKTEDRGKTWKDLAGPDCDIIESNENIITIQFFDDVHGWMVTGGACEGAWFSMLRTDNGGMTWEICRFGDLEGTIVWFDSFYFKSSLDGSILIKGDEYHVTGPDGVPVSGEMDIIFMQTNDGGKNWYVISIIPASDDHVSFEYLESLHWDVDKEDDGTLIRYFPDTQDSLPYDGPGAFFIPRVIYEKPE